MRSLVDEESLPSGHGVRSDDRVDGAEVLASILAVASRLAESKVGIGRGPFGVEEGGGGVGRGEGGEEGLEGGREAVVGGVGGGPKLEGEDKKKGGWKISTCERDGDKD
jgi:hypothetical protein